MLRIFTGLVSLLHLALFFAASIAAQGGGTKSAAFTKQEIRRARESAPCFHAADRTTSEQRDEEAIASLPKIARFWLTEDVAYIISPEERCAFLHLATDRERDQFIEQFWLRRAADSITLDNRFKREHYERIVIANEKFASQLPGWKTDQGRIYIMFGPPDSIESYRSGEKSDGNPDERTGGHGYSRKIWHYNHLEGVGENVEFEFVDLGGSGDYHLAAPPEMKEEVVLIPPYNLGGTYGRVQFKDLEAMAVSRIARQQVQFSRRIEFAKATQATTLTTIVVDLPNDQRAAADDAKLSTDFEVFGRVSKPSGWVVDTFERRISLAAQDGSAEHWPGSQFRLALALGAYRLAIVVKDSANGNTGTLYTSFDVPPYESVRDSQ